MSASSQYRSQLKKADDENYAASMGYIPTNMPRNIVVTFKVPHLWLRDSLYCPVWVEVLYLEYGADLVLAEEELRSVKDDTSAQIVIAAEMRLSPEWAHLHSIVDAFISNVARATR
jgi:hypothetical protein